MPVKLSEIISSQAGVTVDVDLASENVDPSLVPITPDPSIDLAADDVAEAVTELATELYEIENMPSLTLNYTLQRNG